MTELSQETIRTIQQYLLGEIEESYPVGKISELKLVSRKIVDFKQLTENQQTELRTKYRAALHKLKEHAQMFLDDEAWWENLFI